jgi:hypothetical protein
MMFRVSDPNIRLFAVQNKIKNTTLLLPGAVRWAASLFAFRPFVEPLIRSRIEGILELCRGPKTRQRYAFPDSLSERDRRRPNVTATNQPGGAESIRHRGLWLDQRPDAEVDGVYPADADVESADLCPAGRGS